MTARYLVGDVFERLAELPDGSVDLVLTSPPFLALRSYLPADHPEKVKEIGSEPTPAAFLDTLLHLTAEWRRVLAPHGSIAVELGDTYSGSGGAGGDYAEGGLRDGQQKFSGSAAKRARLGVDDDYRPARIGRGASWPLAKSLCGIPHLYHLSLAYGRNLLTGEVSPAGEWRVRNVVAWCRPNPPVGALGDKFRPATSYMTIACTGGSRYFDLDAVRTEPAGVNYGRQEGWNNVNPKESKEGGNDRNRAGEFRPYSNPGGAPPLDWWEIPTQPYAGSHYATWPQALCKRPIEAMVPHKVCQTCGKPSERIVEKSEEYAAARAAVGDFKAGRGRGSGLNGTTQYVEGRHMDRADNVTLGWSDCGHDNFRRGVVLDPFAGSGTTLAVATGLGRDAIGIDLDERNADLARDRVGMFLEVHDRKEAA